MGLRHTKRDENNATIFHSYPCSFLSVFPLSVAIFVGVPMGLWHTKMDENL